MGAVERDDIWRVYAWPETCTRANFVVTADGYVSGTDGRSGSISTPADREVFRALRAGCDAVVVGAGTVRAEGYRPVRVHPDWQPYRAAPPPVLIVVTRSGDVSVDGALTTDLDHLPTLLADHPKALCEGGPGLFSQLLEAGRIDQLALTIAPHLGGHGRLLPEGVGARLRLLHQHAALDTVMTLWEVS